MALVIATTAVLASLLDSLLLRPLTWRDAERLVQLEERRGGSAGRTPWTLTNGVYNAIVDGATIFESVGAWTTSEQVLREQGSPARIDVAGVTPSFLTMFDAAPLQGRLFGEEDAEFGAGPVALISEDLWRSRFSGRSEIVGQALHLDNRQFEIIGVLPRTFEYPTGARVWVPFKPMSLFSRDGKQSDHAVSAESE